MVSEPVNKVVVTHTADATVAAIVGEVDIYSAPELRAAITESIDAATAPSVVIDLSGVTFLGSPGLAALVAAKARTAERGMQLGVVTGDNRVVLRPLEITGLDISFPIRRDMDELRAALRDQGRETRPPR